MIIEFRNIHNLQIVKIEPEKLTIQKLIKCLKELGGKDDLFKLRVVNEDKEVHSVLVIKWDLSIIGYKIQNEAMNMFSTNLSETRVALRSRLNFWESFEIMFRTHNSKVSDYLLEKLLSNSLEHKDFIGNGITVV